MAELREHLSRARGHIPCLMHIISCRPCTPAQCWPHIALCMGDVAGKASLKPHANKRRGWHSHWGSSVITAVSSEACFRSSSLPRDPRGGTRTSSLPSDSLLLGPSPCSHPRFHTSWPQHWVCLWNKGNTNQASSFTNPIVANSLTR